MSGPSSPDCRRRSPLPAPLVAPGARGRSSTGRPPRALSGLDRRGRTAHHPRAEREAFLALAQDYQRDAFIRRFWQVRDPFPQTARNELEERWEERVGARARALRRPHGRARAADPVQRRAGGRVAVALPGGLVPLEIWYYPGSRVSCAGTSPSSSTRQRRRRPLPHLAPRARASAAARPSCARCRGHEGDLHAAIAEQLPRAATTSLGSLAAAVDWARDRGRRVLPKPGEEWLRTFLAYSTDLPAGAAPFPAQLDLAFPAATRAARWSRACSRCRARRRRPSGSRSAGIYNFLVDGEVLRKGELFEHFRYRFILPEASAAGDTIPLVFQRYLRPGAYTLILKVEDVGGKRFFRESGSSRCRPSSDGGPRVAAARRPAAPPRVRSGSPTRAALAEANAPLEPPGRADHPHPAAAPGAAHRQGPGGGADDGRRDRPGELPARRQARADQGEPAVQRGAEPRRPARASTAAGGGAWTPPGRSWPRTRCCSTPARTASRCGWSSRRRGKAYRAEPARPGRGRGARGGEARPGRVLPQRDPARDPLPAAVRAAAPAPPGQAARPTSARWPTWRTATRPRTWSWSTPRESRDQVTSHFVELYTTVVDRRGRPVEGLPQDDFTVFEDGVEQQVRRFELVRDLPIYAGVLLDTSASMGEERRQADAACAAPCASSRT